MQTRTLFDSEEEEKEEEEEEKDHVRNFKTTYKLCINLVRQFFSETAITPVKSFIYHIHISHTSHLIAHRAQDSNRINKMNNKNRHYD